MSTDYLPDELHLKLKNISIFTNDMGDVSLHSHYRSMYTEIPRQFIENTHTNILESYSGISVSTTLWLLLVAFAIQTFSKNIASVFLFNMIR